MTNYKASMEDKFDSEGFIIHRDFIRPEEVSDILENVERFIREIVPNLPSDQVFYEDKNKPATLKQIQQMFKHDSFFHSLMVGSKFEQLASQLLKQPVRPVNMQFFSKPPMSDMATPPHQDGAYFMLEPMEAVTMWLALDKVDEENGCLRYVPGSHKSEPLIHNKTDTLGFSLGLTTTGTSSSEEEILVKVKPGDLAAHHPWTIHRADGNKSRTRTRRALGLIYYGENAKETEAKQKYQKNLNERLKNEGRL